MTPWTAGLTSARPCGESTRAVQSTALASRRAAGQGEGDVRKVPFWRTIVLRNLAALRPSTASDMEAIVL
eukprot:2222595-Prymnesium_polylepis.1